MAHEILSVKLWELDDSLGRLHSRIHLSQAADQEVLRQEIGQLKRECTEAEMVLRDSLRRSKSELVSVLEQGYGQVEQIVRRTQADVAALTAECPSAQSAAEDQILLAEYALDFAHRAADRALLVSMEAIQAQLAGQKEGESQ